MSRRWDHKRERLAVSPTSATDSVRLYLKQELRMTRGKTTALAARLDAARRIGEPRR